MVISPINIKDGCEVVNHFTRPDVIIMAPTLEVRGQGLFSTKW